MQNINLNALRVFAAAARQENFQRAAEDLNISHGAVSQRIKQLEQHLGLPLFERQARGVQLTRDGAAFRTAVDEALSIIDTACADLMRSSDQVTLHIGSSFATKWLMPRMKAFAAAFSDITLTTEIHDSLMDRSLGKGEIAIWPSRTRAAVTAHRIWHLCEVELVAVCAPNMPRPDGVLDISTILALPVLQDAHHRWLHLAQEHGLSDALNLLNFDRSALALEAAIKGHGVAIAPTYMVREDVDAGALTEIWRSPTPSGEHLFLSCAEQHAQNKHVRQTINWVLAEFGTGNAA